MRNPKVSPRSARHRASAEKSEPDAAVAEPAAEPNSAAVTIDGRPMSIGALIHDVARLRRHAFDEQAKPMGLTRSQFSVLAHLGRNSEHGMNQSEIAAALELGKVTLGGLVDRLEAGGLVRRELWGEDRRVKRVRLTTKGRRALETTQRMRPLLDEYVMRDLSAGVRSALASALVAMRSNLLAMQRNRPTPVKRRRIAPHDGTARKEN